MIMEKPRLPISIIIPTYCEEKLLPELLKSIKLQLFQPEEVIVADNNSPDNTREIAKSYGAIVVDGGKVAHGRNCGAAVAKGQLLLFIDADAKLPNKVTLGEAFFEFIRTDSDLASAKYVSDKESSTEFGYIAGKVSFGISNFVRRLQNITHYPRWEGGNFMLMKRNVYDAANGFNENCEMGEDRTFFQDAVRLGYKYRMLKLSIITSTRRLNSVSKVARLALWIATETLLLSVGVYTSSKLMSWFGRKIYGPLGGTPKPDKTK